MWPHWPQDLCCHKSTVGMRFSRRLKVLTDVGWYWSFTWCRRSSPLCSSSLIRSSMRKYSSVVPVVRLAFDANFARSKSVVLRKSGIAVLSGHCLGRRFLDDVADVLGGALQHVDDSRFLLDGEQLIDRLLIHVPALVGDARHLLHRNRVAVLF